MPLTPIFWGSYDRKLCEFYSIERSFKRLQVAGFDEIYELYRNNLKNREFGKEVAQIFVSGASDHCWIARFE